MQGQGNSGTLNNYSYTDFHVAIGTVYYYRLRQIDYDGSINFSNIIAVNTEGENVSLRIAPNPFFNTVSFTYELDERLNARLEILNSSGQIISVLYDGMQDEGSYTFQFDAQSLKASDALYIVRLKTNKGITSIKLTKG